MACFVRSIWISHWQNVFTWHCTAAILVVGQANPNATGDDGNIYSHEHFCSLTPWCETIVQLVLRRWLLYRTLRWGVYFKVCKCLHDHTITQMHLLGLDC